MEKQEKLMLDIQFFAEDDENLDDVDDELEEDDAEDVEDDDNDEGTDDDSNDEDEEEETDENFDDDEEEEEVEKEPKKKKQTRADNSKYAEMRRKQEEANKEKEALKLEGIREGIKQAYNGVNKFTDKPLTDNHSIDLFMMQLEMEKKGLDPINDLPEYIAEKNREKAIELANEEKKKDWFVKDGEDFAKAHPDVSIDELSKDAKFNRFAKGKIGNQPLKEIYEDYMELVGEFNKEADVKSRKAVAKKMASPKASNQNNQNLVSEYSIEKIEKMSPQELVRLEETNPKKYAKIMKAYENFKLGK